MHSWDYRVGDIVEVFPGWRNGRRVHSFKGAVTRTSMQWVFVRQLEPCIGHSDGGWYAHQCQLIIRPPDRPVLPVSDNLTLGVD